MNLSFIIPAFNEEQTLPQTIAAIRENVPKGYQYEVILVDNGSTDSTRQVARTGAGWVCRPKREQPMKRPTRFLPGCALVGLLPSLALGWG